MEAEYTNLQKHAQRVRYFYVDAFYNPPTSGVFLALQPHTINRPRLPRLKTFQCEGAQEGFIPFIPSFLPTEITAISIGFATNSSTTIGSMIVKFPALHPNLEYIALDHLPRDSVITNAVSEMFLASRTVWITS